MVVFFPMSIMEKYCQKEGTVCASNISRVHVGLYEYLLLGREPCRNPPWRDVFLLYHSLQCGGAERAAAGANSQALAAGRALEPWIRNLSFILTVAL